MRRVLYTYLLIVVFIPLEGISQIKVAEIPFLMDRNKVILPTSIQDSVKLNLILDSGMPWDGIYLFKKQHTSHIGKDPATTVDVGGAGSDNPTSSLLFDSVDFSTGNMKFNNQYVVVSQSDRTQTFPTDGIIGWSIFGHYIVDVNFDLQIITLYDTVSEISRDNYKRIPVELIGNIPYLEARVNINGDKDVDVVMYLDMGAGEAIELLVRENNKFVIPIECDAYTLTGLSGDINGKVCRVNSFELAGYKLYDVPSTFPDAAQRSKKWHADGILCTNALRRFNAIFDYSRKSIYIKPNKNFSSPFITDVTR